MRVLIAILFLCPAVFAQTNQAQLGGGAALGGNALIEPGPQSIPSVSAIPLGDPPNTSQCASRYQSTTGVTTKTYFFGLYDDAGANHCADVVPSSMNTAYLNAIAGITPRNTSGTPCSGAGCWVIMNCMGMSIVVASCGTLISTLNGSGINPASFKLLNHSKSNNDLDVWICGITQSAICTTGATPNACAPSYGATQCSSNGPATNQYDAISTSMASQSLTLNQIQAAYVNQVNGTQHQYANGCYTSTGSSSVYYLCNPLDGTHAINDSTVTGFSASGGIDATNVLWELGMMMRSVKNRMPNMAIVFFSAREYAGYCTVGCANPEPEDYEAGMAIKYLIWAQECQIGGSCPPGSAAGSIDPVAGDLCPDTTALPGGCTNGTSGSAPMLAWADCQATGTGACEDATEHSAYLWAKGATARNDGLAWCNGQAGSPCSGALDFASPDFLHLTTAGAAKDVNGMPSPGTNGLLGFFRKSPYSAPWFCATNGASGC